MNNLFAKYKYFSLNNLFTQVTIAIDMGLYEKAAEIFDILFLNFEKDVHPNVNCHYVFEYVNSTSSACDGTIFVNLKNPKWIYFFFVELDQLILMHTSDNTVSFHGSGVVSELGAVLFIGERNTGKSTIVKKLLARPGYSYLDDDIIMVNSGCAWGPGLPLKSRIPNSNYIMECIDETRYISNKKKLNQQPQ